MGFVHLHVHTEFSLLDGACRINQLVDKAVELGQKALAITDHGVMFGAVDFYDKAISAGIKPIIGCEVYVAPRTRFDKEKQMDGHYNHLILLCRNDIGYKNLIYMVSKGFTEGFYSKPRIDKDLLKEHSEGLIALSACIAGEVPSKILQNNYDGAKIAAKEYMQIFGKDNYYIELQDHGYSEDKIINPQLIKLAGELNIPLVATNDIHYINKNDAEMQNVLLCIGTNKTVGEDNPMAFKTNEFYLKSSKEMEELFKAVPQAISNTEKIADMCNFNFEFGKIKLPYFDLGQRDHSEVFRNMCFSGLKQMFAVNPPKEYTDRLNYELDIIIKMGYTDYYLIVSDFVNYAKSQKIPVGPGRGSGAGSLAAYCIGITGIDPIKFDLLFERFLNPERVSMPDFDIDFCYVRRQEVIDYVIRKYGENHVSQIVTFGTLKARAAVRDVGRAYGVPYNICDAIAKLIPQRLGSTIESALQDSKQLAEKYNTDPDVKKIIDMSRCVEGMARHSSTHAAGVVITDKPVAEYVPLSTSDNVVVAQYTMTNLDKLGLLKMDFLGLRNLTVIDDASKSVKADVLPRFDINNIPLNDKETLDMMAAGDTNGVFQYESAGMKSVLRSLKPENMEDLIAVISLYRPGPRQYIPKYIHFRHNKSEITYDTPLLKPILDVTYGCIVYQEQVMQVFRSVAGYSLGRADIVRRAMSKKKHSVLEKERKAFIYGEKDGNGNIVIDGAVNRGVKEDVANKLFDEITAFSSYAFNKSHAAAYAYVAYQTAYLKCHFPLQYMAALLTSVLDFSSKLSEYLKECERLNFKILPPSINSSMQAFTYENNSIRFGLLAIKNLGGNVINGIIEVRKNGGTFKNLNDFCIRMKDTLINKRAVESLIKSGAFDDFGYTRRALMLSIDRIIDKIEQERRSSTGCQISLFSLEQQLGSDYSFTIENSDEFPHNDILNYEKETTDFYISGHPFEQYVKYSAQMHSAEIGGILTSEETGAYKDNESVVILAMVASVKLRKTKSGKVMANLVLEDISGSINAVAFEAVLNSYNGELFAGCVVTVNGQVNFKEDSPPEIMCRNIKKFKITDYDIDEYKTDVVNIPAKKLTVNIIGGADKLEKAKIISELFKGDTEFAVFQNEKQLFSGKIAITDVLFEYINNLFGENNVFIDE